MDQIAAPPRNRPQPATKVIMIFLILIYYTVNFKIEPRCLSVFALIPYEIERGSYWRLITAPIIQSSLPQLILNIIFIWQRFSHVEKRAGAMFLFFHIVIFGIIIGIVYSYTMVLFAIAGSFWNYYKPVLGMSSIIIALNVVESQLAASETASIFGLLHIPTKSMPLAIAIVYQIALGNSCLICHICSLSVGYIYWLLFGKILIRWWSTKQELIQAKRNDDSSAQSLLPNNVVSTFEVNSPIIESSDSYSLYNALSEEVDSEH